MNIRPPSDAAIIAAFWWNDTRCDVACKLHTTRSHVTRVWANARAAGELPQLRRPPKGFDLRPDAMAIAAKLFPQSAMIPNGTARRSA